MYHEEMWLTSIDILMYIYILEADVPYLMKQLMILESNDFSILCTLPLFPCYGLMLAKCTRSTAWKPN